MLKFVDYEKIVNNLKHSVDSVIKDLNNLQNNFISEVDGSLKSENALLRERINNLEVKFNSEFNFEKKFEESMKCDVEHLDFVSLRI